MVSRPDDVDMWSLDRPSALFFPHPGVDPLLQFRDCKIIKKKKDKDCEQQLRNWQAVIFWHLGVLKSHALNLELSKCFDAMRTNCTFSCLHNHWWKTIVVGLPDSSMLSVSGCLLKGSVGELSRCRRMMDRSMMFPEGRITGSVMSVSIRGSVTKSCQL